MRSGWKSPTDIGGTLDTASASNDTNMDNDNADLTTDDEHHPRDGHGHDLSNTIQESSVDVPTTITTTHNTDHYIHYCYLVEALREELCSMRRSGHAASTEDDDMLEMNSTTGCSYRTEGYMSVNVSVEKMREDCIAKNNDKNEGDKYSR